MPKGNEIGFDIRGPGAALTNRATPEIIQQQACLIAVETSYGLFSVLVGIPLTSAYPIRAIGVL
jgi:hypothetical protein